MPATRESDQVIGDFAAQLARRYAAANLLWMKGEAAGGWHWKITSRQGEAERSGGPRLPDQIEDCFAYISLADALTGGTANDVQRVLANTSGAILVSPLDPLTESDHVQERIAAHDRLLNDHGL